MEKMIKGVFIFLMMAFFSVSSVYGCGEGGGGYGGYGGYDDSMFSSVFGVLLFPIYLLSLEPVISIAFMFILISVFLLFKSRPKTKETNAETP